MRFIFRLTLSVTVCFTLPAYGISQAFYIVQWRDTLSEIAQRQVPGRVYGPHGSIAKIIALNRTIRNPNLIFVGQKILIPRNLNDPPHFRPVASLVRSSPGRPSCKPAPALEKSNIFYTKKTAHSEFEIAPSYGLTDLNATDKSTGGAAGLASLMNIGLRFRYHQNWKRNFKTFVNLNLNDISFEPPTDATKTLSHANQFLSGIGVGAKFQLGPTQLTVFTQDQQQIFVGSVSTNNATLSAVADPELGTEIGRDLYQKGSLTLGVAAQGSYLFQTSTDGFDVSSGASFGAKIYLKQDVDGEKAFQTELGYFERLQNTSLVKETQTDLLLRVRWFFPLGEQE